MTQTVPTASDATINAARGKLAIDEKLGRKSSPRIVRIAAQKTSGERTATIRRAS